MAAYIRGSAINWSTASTGSIPPPEIGPIAANSGDLIVLMLAVSGLTSVSWSHILVDNGTNINTGPDAFGFTKVLSGVTNSTTDEFDIYVADAFLTNSYAVLTAKCGTLASTGGGGALFSIAGIRQAGASAVRSSGKQENQAAGTPAPVLSSAPLSTSLMLGMILDATNGSANCVPPSGWTEDFDQGYGTPSTGIEICHRLSGETNTTITFGGATPSGFASAVLELDATDTQVTQTIAEVAESPTTTNTNVSQTILEVAYTPGETETTPPTGGSAGAKLTERKRRNKPDYVGWTIDGRAVDIAWDQAPMSAPGGFERMDASVLTGRLPASMDQGSLIQALRNDGSILYEAKIAAPAKIRHSTDVDQNRTSFYTTGAVDELRRRSRRLPYQLYVGTVWSDQQQPPYTYAATEKSDLFSKDNFVGWTVNNVNYSTGNKSGYALLVKGWDLRRIAFTIKKTGDLSAFDLKLYTANNLGTLTLEHSWALGGANPDGTDIDYTISSPGVGDTLSLQVECTANGTPSKTKVWLNNLRVNGFTVDDSLKTSGVMEDLGNRCGFAIDNVQPSDIYALPLDWTDTWAALADFLAGVDDFYWLVDVDPKQRAFGALAYGPWGGEDQERIWHGELANGVEESLTLLPLYNRVEVTYERPSGVPQVFTATAGGTTGITDPYPSDVFPYPETLRLDVAQADQTMAQTLAENALSRFTKQRAQGTCTVSRIKNGSPLDIRPGDVFKIDDFTPTLPAQRIASVSYRSDGTVDVVLEREFSLGAMLARMSARIRHSKGLNATMGPV